MLLVVFAFFSILCFFIDDNYVAPDFDKFGNIIVHERTTILMSKLLLSLGFINFFMFSVELLSLCLNLSNKSFS